MSKKIALIFCIFIISLFTSCSSTGNTGTASNISSSQTDIQITPSKNETSEEVNYQFSLPKKGEEIGVIKTSFGDITIRFFPNESPKAVENFITHSKEKYYDEMIFHRVINNFMIQTGDPTGTGSGGESIWKKTFDDELSEKLHYFRGAVALANRGPNSNGSQFFIVQNPTIDDESPMTYNKFGSKLIKQYKLKGGAPHLEPGFHYMNSDQVSTGYTIFGQVLSGFDVVDKIASVEVNGSKPVQEVKMLKVEIKNY